MNKTIVALATPPGISGLSVIRLSGDNAFLIADKIFKGRKKIAEAKSHTILYGKIINNNELIDNVTVSVFKEPNSYTGENTVEIGCHGGNLIYNQIIDLLILNGAEFAAPGEFTKRAFLNGKLDLTQAEAVADIIHSNSVPGTQTAARQLDGMFTQKLNDLRKQLLDISGLLELELDFSEEDLELIDKSEIIDKINTTKDFCSELSNSFSSAEILRSGFFVGIAGYPNSGKSTLFNSLLEHKRAIVSEIPGTTRDYLEGSIMLNGISITLFDTAGIRESDDIVEIEGVRLVDSVINQANLVFVLNDISKSRNNSNELYKSLKHKYPDTEICFNSE
jgi:tRNA modification GTPase